MIRSLLTAGVLLFGTGLIIGCSSKEDGGKAADTVSIPTVQDTLAQPPDTLITDTLSAAPASDRENLPDPGADRSKAPSFSLPDLSGRTHRLSDYQGKVVLVDFWATWCPPCRKEIPHLVQIYEDRKENGLVVLGVGIDDEKKLSDFAEEQGITYPILVDSDKETVKLFTIRGIPRTLIIDRRGRVAYDHTGFAPGMETTMSAEIDTLLAETY